MPPQSSHHVVDIGEDGLITQVTPMQDLRQWENGGYFVLRPQIFDHLNEGEDLVEDAIMRRLVPQRRVLAYPYKGYWSPADTVKERARLEEMYQQGNCPWMIWDPERCGTAASPERAGGVAANTRVDERRELATWRYVAVGLDHRDRCQAMGTCRHRRVRHGRRRGHDRAAHHRKQPPAGNEGILCRDQRK